MDIIGIAQTGTGKTLAFTIPVIQCLAQSNSQCLVIVPTRELAFQINETFQKLVSFFGISVVVLVGGVPIQSQFKLLKKNPRIIIATPGRLIDHINRRTIHLNKVEILILDEADRMLDMGFKPDIERIIKTIPKKRQTMLFSATIPKEVMKIGTKYMKLPLYVEVAPSGTAAEQIVQELFIVKKENKNELLEKLLNQYSGSVLLFSRTRIGASKIKKLIKTMGYKVAEIHSDRTLRQRKEALDGFKNGRYRVLVATDIAARGIDVVGIEMVINYDLPDDIENYVHRIGRTGRAGYKGRAISFATPEQGKEINNIEKYMKTNLPISEHPELPKEKFIVKKNIKSRTNKFKKRINYRRKKKSFHKPSK